MISSLELAKRCNVSQGTVDRALHNRPGISKETKAHILKMAEEHGYTSNPAALEILGKGSTMVGVLTPALNSSPLMQRIQVIQDTVTTRGYRTFTTPFRDEEQFIEGLKEFSARKAAGIIVFPNAPGPTIPQNIVNATKIISLMEPLANKGAFYVSPDNQQLGGLCAQKLIAHGHRNILMLNYNLDRVTVRERKAGFEACAESAGVTHHHMYIEDIDSLPRIVKSKAITGIYGHTDTLAFHAIRILSEHGIQCPGDISIIGGEDHPAIKDLYPGIANYQYPIESIAENILAILEGKAVGKVPPPCFLPGTTFDPSPL